MTYHTILVDQADGLARITLNRPAVLNALTVQCVEELLDAVRRAGADAVVRALLITGAGRAFSSGADLGGDGGKPGEVDAGACLESHFNPLLEALFALTKPVVAAVNGPAAGAGFSLALAADIILAGQSAYFVQSFANIGLVPDVGSTWLLPRQVGRARALGLMMLGEKLSAAQAYDWGLIWRVVEDDALAQVAQDLAQRLAAGPTRAYALLRDLVRQGGDGPLSASLDLERKAQAQAGYTEDFAEGVAAFLGKRKPAFTGR